MRQQSSTPLSYVGRHIVFFLLCGFVPACFLALCDNSGAVGNFWVDFYAGDISSSSFFAQYIYAHILVNASTSWLDIVLMLICVATLAMSWSVLVYRTDRHMQLGIVIKEGLFAKSMSVFWRTFTFVVMVFAFSQLTLLLVVGMMYLLRLVIIIEVVAPIILALTIVQKIMIIVVVYIFMVSLPVISAENYPLFSALSYSSRLSSNRKYRAQTILVTLITLLMYLIMVVVKLLPMPEIISTIIVGLLIYAWIICMPAVACVRFVTDIEAERKDIKNTLF